MGRSVRYLPSPLKTCSSGFPASASGHVPNGTGVAGHISAACSAASGTISRAVRSVSVCVFTVCVSFSFTL